MQIETHKYRTLSCIKRAYRTEFGECKQVEALFIHEMVGRRQVSHWRLVPQFPFSTKVAHLLMLRSRSVQFYVSSNPVLLIWAVTLS
jgi:hypothetical protein